MTMTMTMTTTMPMTIPTPMTMTTTMTMLVQEAAGADQMDIEVRQDTEVSRALRTRYHQPLHATRRSSSPPPPQLALTTPPDNYPTSNENLALGYDILSADRRGPSPCRTSRDGGRASPTRFRTRSSMV